MHVNSRASVSELQYVLSFVKIVEKRFLLPVWTYIYENPRYQHNYCFRHLDNSLMIDDS